jgi:hypothetical protein
LTQQRRYNDYKQARNNKQQQTDRKQKTVGLDVTEHLYGIQK